MNTVHSQQNCNSQISKKNKSTLLNNNDFTLIILQIKLSKKQPYYCLIKDSTLF